MTEFDVARIVPSTRDFAGAVCGRNGLALVPVVPACDAAAHVARLDEIDVRAIAIRERGEASLAAARATESTPLLVLEDATDVESCQRGRFFGSDCVQVTASQFAELQKTVQSMRMMPAARVTSAAEAAAALEAGARVLVVSASSGSDVAAICADVDKRVIVVADVEGIDADELRSLSGVVDAATVPTAVHADASFEALLDELD